MNVITAIGDENLNNLLRKEENINLIGFDIQYQDGIFEFLENNKNIDYLILNINLIGDLNYEDLIEKIKEKNKNIILIIFLEKENIKINNYLIKNNIKFILNKNNFNLENIIYILKNNKINLISENNNLKFSKSIFRKEKYNRHISFDDRHFLSASFRKKSVSPACGYQNKQYYIYNKIINIIKLIFNLKNIQNKIIKNNNYKINIFLNIKINNKKNKFKINKKLNSIKYENKIFNRDDLLNEILKIIKEEF